MRKAMLLAAGLGTRLRPLTNTIPKCLVEIHNRPLLGWWLELLEKNGFEEVLINTHYLSSKVDEYIKNRYDGHIKVTLAYEEELLGSAGTVYANREFYEQEEDLAIFYADNLTDIDIKKMMQFHEENKAAFTMGLFMTNKPKECGIAALDENKTIIEFEEKPEKPKSSLANAGIYMIHRSLYSLFQGHFDIGKEILPELTGIMKGYQIAEYLLDIGSLENLEKARREWPHDDHL